MITAEKFHAYEDVRSSGETNMFDVGRVIELSDYSLTREEIIEIMERYSELKELFNL